jgi:hypothetical protein
MLLPGLKPLGQRGMLNFATQLINSFEPTPDVAVEFLAMVPVVS